MVVSVRSHEGEDHEGGSPTLQTLIEASQAARASANWVRARSDFLCKRAEIAQRHAVEARLQSRSPSRYARVQGTVDGHASVAVVHRDGTVVGDRPLLRRVDLVVSLGDTFGDGKTIASIGLDPLASTLSTARAYDSVSSVDVFGGLPPRKGTGVEPASDAGPAVSHAASRTLVIAVERGDGAVALHLQGELDFGSADGVAAELDSWGAEETDVTVDLSKVTFIDARGVAVLVTAHQTLALRGRTLVVRGAKGIVRRTLQMCEIPKLLGGGLTGPHPR